MSTARRPKPDSHPEDSMTLEEIRAEREAFWREWMAIRERYLASGGRIRTREEILEDARERRGGGYTDEELQAP